MASPADLTTLAAVKAWLNIANSNSDSILAALITAASRLIYASLARSSLLPQSFVERTDGNGRSRLFLPNWPVLSIDSLIVDGHRLAEGFSLQPPDAAPPGRPQAIDLDAHFFPRGRQNVTISYRAGYAIIGEATTIPSAAPYQCSAVAQFGPWASDLGVFNAATGAPLSAVTSTPGVGQYLVATGVYTFAAADAGRTVAISYGFVPQDIAQVCSELVGERYFYRLRIGEVSKSLGGQETVSFSQKDMPDALAAMLAPYRAVMLP